MSERLPSIPLVSRVLEVCVRELGIVQIAKRLRVTPVQIDRWQTGAAPMPKDSFLQLVDVLVALNPGWQDRDDQ